MGDVNRDPWWAKLAVGLAAVACFGIFTWLRDGDFGALVAFSISAVAIGASARWDSRNRWYYWAALALISLAHILFVMRVSIQLPSPAIKIAPLVILDYALIVLVISAFDRLCEGKGRTEA
jgi:hypothetical protein